MAKKRRNHNLWIYIILTVILACAIIAGIFLIKPSSESIYVYNQTIINRLDAVPSTNAECSLTIDGNNFECG